MFHRQINLPKTGSYFLFGARGTGKSTLVKSHYPESRRHYINLLLAKEEDHYARNPDELLTVVKALPKSIKDIIIDEIQNVPKLLDIVHELIETTDKRFILTGSSARKLKAGGANLLAGRAFERSLFPLTYRELGDRFDLNETLHWGLLPQIFKLPNAEAKRDFLSAYAQTYLKEEIWAEQYIRKLDPFRKFLEIAAQANGTIVNFANIANDTGVDPKTIKTYFEILEDTLLGFFLEPYAASVRKTVYKSPKFYFFDTGVTRALARLLDVPPKTGTSYYGQVFEQFVVVELHKQLKYSGKQYRMYYLRTQADNEIDVIIDRPGKRPALIEIKSTTEMTESKVRAFRNFSDEFPDADFLVFSQDPRAKVYDGVRALHWRAGLELVFPS